MSIDSADPILDCGAGRQLGCDTFCCRLIVKPAAEERVPGKTPAGTLAKNPRDGWCVHLDRATHDCAIWEDRPDICRGYDCNTDPLLQVVVRDSYSDLIPFQLRDPAPAHAQPVTVPYRAPEHLDEEGPNV